MVVVMTKGDWAGRPVWPNWIKGKYDLAAGLRPAATLQGVAFPNVEGGKHGCAVGGEIKGKHTFRNIAGTVTSVDPGKNTSCA